MTNVSAQQLSDLTRKLISRTDAEKNANQVSSTTYTKRTSSYALYNERGTKERDVTETIDIEHLQQWVGKSESNTDVVTAAQIKALDATLDHPDQTIQTGQTLPALWHWLYFLPMARHSDIDESGHAKRGGFLPPVPLPRRMWAGSQLEFHQPLLVGDTIERRSTIDSVTHKKGNSGTLVFVKVKHQIDRIGASRSCVITEYHDIVYRAAPQDGAKPSAYRQAPSSADWEKEITTDDVLLFRYSALTFNAHRIHYDRAYATEVEGYPGLIVHGPLIATLLLDTLRTKLNNPIVTHFNFKAIKPVFDINPFYVCGAVDEQTVRLWAKDHLGDITMEAVAKLVNFSA